MKAQVLVFSALFAIGANVGLAQSAAKLPKVAKPAADTPVTLTDNGTTWTLDNGIIKATINKSNGNMPSLIYHGVSIVGHSEFWEQTPSGTVTATVTIDPSTNGGQRAEVSVHGVNPGTPGVRGGGGGPAPGTPGANPYGVPAGPGRGGMDIEVRYTIERGTSGFYTYAEYTHPASYPPASEGESRFILQMNPTFNWISVDDDRNQLMVTNADEHDGVVIHAKEQRILTTGVYKNSVEHKYSYNAVMYKLRAWGWSELRRTTSACTSSIRRTSTSAGAPRSWTWWRTWARRCWTTGPRATMGVATTPRSRRANHGSTWWGRSSSTSTRSKTRRSRRRRISTSSRQPPAAAPAVPHVWHDNGMALWNDALEKAKSVKAAWPYAWSAGCGLSA